MSRNVIFWYEFASTYSYLTAMRIDDQARHAGVSVEWRPFLLGPIFATQGWTTSPFNIYPAKGTYMVRDIGRIAAERGLAFAMPKIFPVNGLKAARIAIAVENFAERAAFTREAYRAQFADGADIADDGVLKQCLLSAGLDAETIQVRSTSEAVKLALRNNTERAIAAGIFGAPSFTTSDGEVFWGDDRLDQALAWSRVPRT